MKELEQMLTGLMSSIEGLAKSNDELKTSVQKSVNELKSDVEAVKKETAGLKAEPVTRNHKMDYAEAKAPVVTTGEINADSRGYSIMRAIKAVKSRDFSNAKLELGVHNALKAAGYGRDTDNFLMPLDAYQLEQVGDGAFKGLSEQLAKTIGHSKYRGAQVQKGVLSRGTAADGGYLVNVMDAPQIVDVLYQKSILGKLPVFNVNMPQSGKLTFNKGTTDATAYWVGDESAITVSDPQFGETSLDAKMVAALVKVGNNLLKDANPSIELYLRRRLGEVLAAKESSAFLDGASAANRPSSIANTQSGGTWASLVGAVTAVSTGTDGDTLTAPDLYQMIESCHVANGEFQGWIMRHELWNQILQFRAGGYSASDGPYLFDGGRSLADRSAQTLLGFPVFLSNHCANDRAKGAASNLGYLYGGALGEIIVGRHEVLEIDTTDKGDTAFTQNETWFRAIQRIDWSILRPAALMMIDDLVL